MLQADLILSTSVSRAAAGPQFITGVILSRIYCTEAAVGSPMAFPPPDFSAAFSINNLSEPVDIGLRVFSQQQSSPITYLDRRKGFQELKVPSLEVRHPRCVGSITKNFLYYAYSQTQLYFTY